MNSAVTVLHPPVPARQPGNEAPPPAMRLLVVIAEAMFGRRPLHQIRPVVGPRALEQITRVVDEGTVRLLRMGRIRTQMPTPSAVEAVVRLVHRDRTVVAAIRLDRDRGAWRCTDVAVLLPDSIGRRAAA